MIIQHWCRKWLYPHFESYLGFGLTQEDVINSGTTIYTCIANNISVGNLCQSACLRSITLEEDRKLFVDFSSILCFWFEIQGMRTYNVFEWVSNTEYHAHWCPGDFRSQCISRHDTDPQSQNILSPAMVMKIIGHVGHFRWLGPNVWWEISQFWIEYIKPIGQLSDGPWKFFVNTAPASKELRKINYGNIYRKKVISRA